MLGMLLSIEIVYMYLYIYYALDSKSGLDAVDKRLLLSIILRVQSHNWIRIEYDNLNEYE